jgi:hypothetical protein
MTILERFNAQYIVAPPSDCWLWTGATSRTTNGNLYGSMRVNGRQTRAPRLSYELFKEPIPTGLHIDHLCRVSLCVNPAHLEAVTQRENTLRGTSFAAVLSRETHCRNGHEYSPDNTRIVRKARQCIACLRASQKQNISGKRLQERRWRRVEPFEVEEVSLYLQSINKWYNGCIGEELTRRYGTENLIHKAGYGWYKLCVATIEEGK